MNTYTTTPTAPRLTAAQVAAAVVQSLALVALYLIQTAAHIIRTAYRLSRQAWAWANSRHNFGNEEGDIILTGWQYLALLASLAAVVVVLSVNF